MNKSKARYAYASATDLRSLVNSFGEAVLVVDEQGEVVFADPNAEQLFDRDVSHLLGETAPCELREGELAVPRGETLVRAHCRSEELVWSGNLATAYFLRAVDRAWLDLEGKLSASEERISLAEEALREAEVGKTLARERLDEVSVELEGLSQENELLKATVAELEKQVAAGDQQNAALNQSVEAAEQALGQTEQRLANAEERIRNLQQELEMLEQKAHQSEQRAALAEGGLKAAEERATRYKTVLDEMESTSQGTTQRLAVLEEGLRAAEERAERYRRLAAGSVEMESVHSEELASAQRRVEQLEGRVRELESESSDELTESRNWVAELEARVAELEADHEGQVDSDQLEAARFRIAELEAQLAQGSPLETGPELEALRFRVAELEARLAELSEAETLATQLEEARARIEALQAQAGGGDPQLIEALERIRDLEAAAASASSLEVELEATREQVEALERENEELAEHGRRRTAELESQMAVALEAAAARLAEIETNLGGGDGPALEEACARVVELETQCEQLSSYRGLAEQLQVRVEELEASPENSWDQQALEQARLRISELEQRLAQDGNRSAVSEELEQELEEARRRADDAESRVLELEEQLLELRDAPALAESTEVVELRERAEQAESRLTTLASQVSSGDTHTDQIIQQLEQRAAQAELRSSELERELEDKRSQMPDRETQKLAYADRLTGLPNFNILQQYINLTFEKVSSGEGAMALLVVDLDRFRVVNDTLGHRAGDDLLRRVAKVLQTITKKADYALARRGEDEFLLVAHLESVENDVAQVTALARGLGHSILTELAKPFELSGQTIHVTVSIGISLYPGEARTAQEMLEEADCAMYRAKELGRGRVCFYTAEMHQAQKRRLVLENELRRALDQNEFLVYYQPIIDLHSGKLAGLEALLRWAHPSKGVLEPEDFIDIAEETGLIVPIGEWVVQEACMLARQLKKRFVTINLSPRQLIDSGFSKRFMKHVERAGIRPDQVVVEVSESTNEIDPERVHNVLSGLVHWGVGVGIDDFGTGSTSLRHLHKVPVRFIKIDREFVSSTPEDRNAARVCLAVARLAAGLEVAALAEGVETEAQVQYVSRCGCQLAQGFFFSPPVPPSQLKSLLESRWSV